MPDANVRGLRLYFEEHGAGPCVIAVHGLFGSVATATVMNATMLAAKGLRVVLSHPNDAMHPLHSGELIRDAILGASLHVAPSAQHWQRNPDAFCELVASFVQASPS